MTQNVALPFDPAARYVASERLEASAQALIARHEARFGHLVNFRILYLERLDGDPGPEIDTIAKCVKVAPLWRDVTGWDFVIWGMRGVLNAMSPLQVEAVVAHELSHAGMTEKGRPTIWPHDVEDFSFVAHQYGAWHEGLRIFARSLNENVAPAAAPAATADVVPMRPSKKARS